MVSEYITNDEYRRVRRLLTDENRLALDLSIKTGLRIGDVVALPAAALGDDNRLTYTASKTGKSDVVKLDKKLSDRLRSNSDRRWLFPAKVGNGHRTRQAVWKNLRDCCDRLGFKAHISPHSVRKAFAVELLHSKGLKAVQKALQHDNAGTTMLYAYSDITRSCGCAKAKSAGAADVYELLFEIVRLLTEIRDVICNK